MDERQARDAIATALGGIIPDVDLGAVRAEDRLRDALDLDSLDFLSLVDALHALTGVSIPESDYPEVESLDAMVRYLVDHAP